jgi:aldehyde:ferredoxin oxidoreductase
MSNSFGWAGKILRVNLSNGSISTEDTEKYKKFVGGMGIAYKIMWDEVPAGTAPYDEANKIVFGAGPLAGSGAPCSSRTNVTSILPTNPYNLISDSHFGGHFSPELKYAGYDMIVIEGKSPNPVWLRIEDDKVTLEDAVADGLWGTGVYKTTELIDKIMGGGSQVATIGQAGENMVNMSTIIANSSHSGGGHGGVLGSKKLKAIAIKGTKPVRIAADRKKWNEVDEYMMTIIGANNQHVVPRHPQPWAEYTSSGSRWTANPGKTWGAAKPPVDTGTAAPDDVNSMGLRTHKGWQDLGPLAAEKYVIRMGGCQSCPIRCHSYINHPKLPEYGFNPVLGNTCLGWSGGGDAMMHYADGEQKGEDFILGRALGTSLINDYGIWCNYGLRNRELHNLYKSGLLKEKLPKEEYDRLRFDLLEEGNPEFLIEYYRSIAFKDGILGSLIGQGSYYVMKYFGLEDFYKNDYTLGVWNPKLVFPKHHSNEANGQVGALASCFFNRDAQTHSTCNFLQSGLPIEIKKEILSEIPAIGSGDAMDEDKNYTPMNVYKAKYAKWGLIRNCLHDSLTLCNWMWPMTCSPRKDKGYRGDTSLESKFFSMATGIETSEDELDLMGEKILTLHRAMCVKQMGTKDMRNEHDIISDWVFDKVDKDADGKELAPFTPGTIRMDREDMKLALTMFYKEMGWDEVTGAPTKATLVRLGLDDVAAELEALNLL